METNTLTQEEFDYIKSIDTGNYLIDNIDTENDPIYKKLSELDIINNPEKIKEFIKNLVDNYANNFSNPKINKIEFYKFIFYVHTNFSKILQEHNEIDNLIKISTNCGLFDFGGNQYYRNLSFQNITYTLGKNYNEFQEDLSKEILNKLIEQNEKNLYNIVIGFVEGYLSQGKNISEIQNTILELAKQNSGNIVSIVNGFVHGCLFQGKNISEIQNTIIELVKQNKQNPNNIFNIVGNFVYSCLSQGKNISEIQNTILELVKQNSGNIVSIVDGFVRACLSKSKGVSEIQNTILELVEQNKQNPNNIANIVGSLVQGCLSQGKDIPEIQNTILELVEQNKQNPNNIANIVGNFVYGCLSQGKDIPEIQNTILELVKQNSGNIVSIVDGFVRACLSKSKSVSEIQNTILELVEQNKQNPNNIDNIVNSFISSCPEFIKISSNTTELQYLQNFLFNDIIKKYPNNTINVINSFINYYSNVSFDIVRNFVTDYLKKNNNNIDKNLQKIILELVRNNPNNIVSIIEGVVKGYLSQGNSIQGIESTILELLKQNPNNIVYIVGGFVKGCNIQQIQKIILELVRNNPNNIVSIIEGVVKGYLSQGNSIRGIESTILELIRNNPNNIVYIVGGVIRGYLSQGNSIQGIESTILELIRNNPNNIDNIVEGVVKGYLSQGKNISEIQNFIFEASKQENIGIDIVYNIIYSCCLNSGVQIDSENFKQLIQVINNSENQKKEESQKILCGMYISDYLFKIHHNEIDKDNIIIPQEFIVLLNEVLKRQEGNKITKIEDLTVKEIKTLFDNLMDIKFNQTKAGVDSNRLETGAFLQIIISLAENNGISVNTTIGELFNKQKGIIEKTKLGEQLTKIETFQKKLNNFSYIGITEGTQINSIEDFIKILGLKPEDFGKPEFKTFGFTVPGHAVTLVIDTSKSYEEFIENNKDKLKDIVMIDSSQVVNWMMNVSMLKFSDPNTEKFIKKIPVPNFNYQENGTCWGNTTCANSALLNNYKNFDEIVERNENGEIIGLKKGVEEKIINETSKYYVSNTEIETNKSKYYDVEQTNIVAAEFRGGINTSNSNIGNNQETIYNDKYTIKSNVKQKQLFQKPLEVFKAQQYELKDKQLTQYKKNLKQKKEDIEKQLEEGKLSVEDFNKKYEEYKEHKEEFKKINKKLDLIVDVKLDYTPAFGKEEQVENFRCYTNSKHANDTILSFDMYMGNTDKKVSVKFVLKNTDIKTVNEEFIKQWEEKIKTEGLESCLKENCEIKIKTEELNNYVNLRESHHKNRICGMMKSGMILQQK